MRFLCVQDSQSVTDIRADSQLSFKNLFLYQVLHSANLHLIHIIHKTGPICAPVCTLHGLWLVGGVRRGWIFVCGGHTVAAVTKPKASESRCQAGSCEGSPAALTGHWPVVPVDLLMVNTQGRMWILPKQHQLWNNNEMTITTERSDICCSYCSAHSTVGHSDIALTTLQSEMGTLYTVNN